jgi:hypothetical protein
VLFRCESLQHALSFFGVLAGAGSSQGDAVFLRADTLLTIAVAAVFVLAPLVRADQSRAIPSRRVVALASALLVFLLSAGRMGVNSFQPFLYFRF